MYMYFLLLPLLFQAVRSLPTNKDISHTTVALVYSALALDGIRFENCTVTDAIPPLQDSNPQLPAPSQGLKLKHVALGRGTQNYTCSSSDASTVPAAVGAVASLFDASCLATKYPNVLHQLPPALMQLPVDGVIYAAMSLGRLLSSKDGGLVLGQHYFADPTTPFFDLRLCGYKDWAAAVKNASVSAPHPLQSSTTSKDEQSADVPWLKLESKDGVGIKEVYRLVTAGGSPPATCEGQAPSFDVDYAAEYWFYG
ncbi:hypothetical protein VTN00DRAFT_6738 [Thermoascus crustaceus]|uniref:uncharacterized protein n=1 Tax=Thermoascus crustaceus TaxID=5088 RepID=UPI0037436894